jgi:hypothetical protein
MNTRDEELGNKELSKADASARDYVMRVQSILNKEPIALTELKESLVVLFEYLSSKDGRTKENCRAVDLYFTFNDAWAKKGLPCAFLDIFQDMSGSLHDTISAPNIAEKFLSTPEQLLTRLKNLIAD